MPESWRRTGRRASDDHFVGLAPAAVIEAAAYHDDGSRMGHFLFQLQSQDPLKTDKDDGKTWTGVALAIEDDYYRWWYETTVGKLKDKKECYFHFCRTPQHRCLYQGGYRLLVHVDVFRVLQPDEVEATRWLNAGQKTEVKDLMYYEVAAPAGAAPSPAGAPGVEPGAAGVSGLRAALEKGPGVPGGADDEIEERRPREKRRRSKSPGHDKRKNLGDPDTDEENSEDYMAVLQKRKPAKQAESALRLRRSKKKKKKKKKKDKKTDEKEEEKKRKRDESSGDSSSSSSSGESVFRMAPLPEGIDRLKRTHLKRPGRLADLTLQRYQELLLRSTGRGAELEDHQVLPPVGRAYLQQVYFVKNPTTSLGVRTAREMRTLMLAVDYLAKNMVTSALDVLLQRQKALELSVEQGNWLQANLLELVDMEEARSYFNQEIKAAQSQLRVEQRLGKGGRSYRAPPPWWEGRPAEGSKTPKEGKDGDAAPTNEEPRKGKRGKKGRGKGRW
eukprot:Skav210611  [mRNA]  locus=scaffold234:219117:220619:+ [translate_table: standard]